VASNHFELLRAHWPRVVFRRLAVVRGRRCRSPTFSDDRADIDYQEVNAFEAALLAEDPAATENLDE
jgi:hypothetical protein